MKNLPFLFVVSLVMALSIPAAAQHAVSFDLAGIRNMQHNLNGINVSGFYHFSKRLVGGIEMNRFFKRERMDKENNEAINVSAWDFDLNFHYLLPILPHLRLYPITGISHTSEKETGIESGLSVYERFWSFNAGAGVLLALGKWSPHVEYLFTWGPQHQQFLLAGISYEMEWGKDKHEK